MRGQLYKKPEKKQKVDTSVPLKTSGSGSGERSCLLLSLTVAGLVGCSRQSASPPPSKDTVVPAGEIGSRMPGFTIEDFQACKISSNELHGKVGIVDFWATSCQPGASRKCAAIAATTLRVSLL
jgi:cytochrome oxidase Cu insertion factor (SCO1/SenC/PrrC family)